MEASNGKQLTLHKFKEELNEARTDRDKINIYASIYQLGNVCSKEYNFDDALQCFSLCLEIASEIKDDTLEATARLGIGNVYRLKKEFAEALSNIDEAFKIASKAGNDYEKALALILEGIVQREIGNFSIAKEQNEKGFKLALQINSSYLLSQAHLAFGIVYRLMENFDKALEHYSECRKIASAENDEHNLARANLGLGIVYKILQKYDNAISSLESSLHYAQEIAVGHMEYLVCQELGNVYKLKKNYFKAMEYFGECSKIPNFPGPRTEHLELGVLNKELQRHQNALEHLEKYLKVLKESEDTTEAEYHEARKHIHEINIYLKRHETAKSVKEKLEQLEEGGKAIKRTQSFAEQMLFEVLRVEKNTPWRWNSKSENHRNKFWKLWEKQQQHSKDVKQISGVRFCCALDCRIGAGSRGTEVFVALVESDGSEKAVKRMLKNQCLDIAKHEKKILEKKNTVVSRYTVKYWSLDEDSSPDFVYLFMDLCEETLADFVLRKNKTELEQEVRNVLSNVLSGLVNLHRNGNPIVHGDLKPTNILRNKYGDWLLADFGISRSLNDDPSYHKTDTAGAEFWRPPEAITTDEDDDTLKDGKLCYVKKSDIQVAGMVAYHVVTKGKHPFGKQRHRLSNLLDGKPVGLDTLEDKHFALKDLLSWMLSHKPEDRPCAVQALKHPYFLPSKGKFELLHKMGNEPEIKQTASSNVVKELNRDSTDWKTKISKQVFDYLQKGGRKDYGSEWTECLRFIRNCQEHWQDKPQDRPVELSDEPHEFFMNLFPDLPVKVHKIVRNCDWKGRSNLKKFFNSENGNN